MRSILQVTLLLLLTCVAGSALFAEEVRPAGLSDSVLPLTAVAQITTPTIDLPAIQAEDRDREALGLPPRFAVPHPVRITPASHGDWERLDKQTDLWRLRFSCPDAVSINLGFTRYRMPAGGRLLIYSADYESIVRPFTERDNEPHGQLWTPPVPGDEIVVEVTVPRRARRQLQLELTAVNHGFTDFGLPERGPGLPERGPGLPERMKASSGGSGSCNVDVLCPESDGWWDQVRSVAAYSLGGSIFCTGAMINNTAQDFKPYFLTADHCGVHAGNAASLVTFWQYQSFSCRTPGTSGAGGAGDGLLNFFQTGAVFRADWPASDFTLVELDDDPDPSFNVFWAGWNRSSGNPVAASGVHHPRGQEKRISHEYDATTTTSYLGTSSPGNGTHLRVIDWDDGTTEPGSSGSPLFDPGSRIVGQLHGGDAACGNDESDWYGRLSRSWTGGGTAATRLKDWLDPGNTGATSLDGITKCYGNSSVQVEGVVGTCMGESLQCQALWHECVGQSGTITVSGGGFSGSYTQIGYRCGGWNTWDEFIEVYVDDEKHEWPWPDYCLREGDTLTLQAGRSYDFRGPSMKGATPLPFTLASGFVASECVGVNYLLDDLGLSAATCAAYCASIGKSCSNSCTTNRDFPNWGVEAWYTENQCQSYSTSGGQVKCTTNLANYSNHHVRKYRCCCV